MSLKDWLRSGWLSQHTTSREEIHDLLGVVERDLLDSASPALSPDWRLNIAYNAALQAATAALAAAGYRATREAHHYRVIQTLAYTISADSTLIKKLDGFRKKRNIGGYERAGLVSDQEAKEMLVLARALQTRVTAWLRREHSELAAAKRR
ncbi:MAG: hypothetical protein ACR2L2_04385 [Acidobacteriota bacterium]